VHPIWLHPPHHYPIPPTTWLSTTQCFKIIKKEMDTNPLVSQLDAILHSTHLLAPCLYIRTTKPSLAPFRATHSMCANLSPCPTLRPPIQGDSPMTFPTSHYLLTRLNDPLTPCRPLRTTTHPRHQPLHATTPAYAYPSHGPPPPWNPSLLLYPASYPWPA